MSKRLIIGASLGLSGIEAVICNDQFEVIQSESRLFPGHLGKESFASKIAKTITSLPDFHNASALGVSVPATFDETGKKIVSSSIKELEGADLFQLLSRKVDLPIFIFRRNFCYLLAEQAFGSAKSAKNAVLVEIGRDIEASLLISGKIYRGSTNSAGQIAETIVDITREKRNQGGEFGTLISGEGIEALTGKSVYQILKENPQSEIVSKQILRDLKESLLTGLYNIKIIFDPDVLIIGGDILENWGLFQPSFHELKVEVVKSEMGKKGPALGAALAAYNTMRARQKKNS